MNLQVSGSAAKPDDVLSPLESFCFETVVWANCLGVGGGGGKVVREWGMGWGGGRDKSKLYAIIFDE